MEMKTPLEGLWFFGLFWTFMVSQAKPSVLKREMVMVSSVKANWTEAQSWCRVFYHDLASILDSNTNQLVEDMVSDKDEFWIGLFNEDLNWRWSWIDSRRKNPYRHWEKKHVFLKGGDDGCVMMKDDGLWRAEQCLKTMAFVCSQNSSEHPYVLVNQERSWFSAQRYCRRTHIDLVTVSSHEENKALLELMEQEDVNQTWIGLHRSQWIWSDSSVYQFSRWSRIQESRGSDRRACVAMGDGEWRGRNCSDQLVFLCERLTDVNLPVTNEKGLSGVELPVTNEKGVYQNSVRMRMKIQTKADLNDPAVSQQLKAALALKIGAHVSVMDVKAETCHKERDSCEVK